MFEESKTLNPETTTPESTTKSSEDQEMFNLDVCFLIDTTGSMQPSINMARDKIKEIITGLKSQYSESEFRIAIVSYKDHGDQDQHQIFAFDTDVEAAHSFLGKLTASGGGDHPEDVNGGFRHALKLDWKKLTTKMLYHLADAPCHGPRFHKSGDSFPDGLEGDLPWEELLKTAYEMDINYLFFDIGSGNKLMYEEFKKIFVSCGEEKGHLIFSYEPLIIKNQASGKKKFKSVKRSETEEDFCMEKKRVKGKVKELFDMPEAETKEEERAPEHSEKFVYSTVTNAKEQMMKNISYQKSKKI